LQWDQVDERGGLLHKVHKVNMRRSGGLFAVHLHVSCKQN